ncbi:MAG: low-specificity L-threonine aldolase [Salibacteraceae bacterium]|jgi:threonine aldolase|nr:low-specificity L-threonine aldolase [Salibacteraceae bacterium]MDP4687707.1 low-specificity L-threonine aldolase [Salibacteraceae bacterium]MDP4762511.1 low-specificity L-threonine aldolase [Salibacteraceae bacterium]MDP4935620.1 low-specificity L-threonine aldolase [Salibacteraceae bacterium]MDP4964853.1 low-specificity L-threonine aldolase [Salibacteraceae bacterium]
MIDFRSDTVTKPTEEMREVMASAPLGDDVFQDDPSINALEAKVAAMFGHEAALFCPSGTMTNQIAIKVHTQPGDEVICDQLAHIYNYEGGGIAFNSSASVRLLHGDKGRFTANMVKDSILPDDVHNPRTRLVAAENTMNKGGGTIWDSAELKKIQALCKANNLAFHLDGARLFNALVETGESTQSVGETFDSISICLSKGLGCPVGSLLIGNAAFIKQARRVRKVFGGGMRQAGMLAAAGIYALDYHIDRLKEDHAKARYLAEQLPKATWCKNVITPQTNIVIAELEEGIDQAELLVKMKAKHVLAVGFGKGKIRFVTHLDVSEAQVEQAALSLLNL